MDLEDLPTLAYSLICKIVHKGRQADALASQESQNGFHHLGQHPWGAFETEW